MKSSSETPFHPSDEPPITGQELLNLYAELRQANQARIDADKVSRAKHQIGLGKYAVIADLQPHVSGLQANDHLGEFTEAALQDYAAEMSARAKTTDASTVRFDMRRLLLGNTAKRKLVAEAMQPTSRAITKIEFQSTDSGYGFVQTDSVQRAEGTIDPSSYLSLDQGIIELKPARRWRQPDHYQVTLFEGDEPQVDLRFTDEI